MNEANRRTWQSIVRPILGLQFGLWLVLAVWALPQPARADFSSTEASTISWFYAAAFGRTPVPNSAASDYGDLGGLAFWTDAYLTGAGGLAPFRGNVYAIADFFVTSDEFQAKYPASLTNEAFIMALYDNMLGRAADEGGLAFWVGQLSAGASRGTVLADFTNTPENQNSNPLRKAALESFIAFIDADADRTITPAEAAVWLAQNPTLDGALVDGASSEYQPGTTAPLTTDFEDVSEFSPGGAAMTLTLGDGTRASVPPLAGDYALLLERSSPEEALTQLMAEIQATTALAPTGSVRWLVALGEGDPSNLKPVITIPAHEAGTVNLETVNVLRVGDVLVNGEMVPDHVTMLPVSVDGNGNLRFVDPLMRDALQDASSISSAPSGWRLARSQSVTVPSLIDRSPAMREKRMRAAQAGEKLWVGSAAYFLMTFQDDLNWKRPPSLVRMIPNEGVPDTEMPDYRTHYRRPATPADLADLAKQPICNIMLLVHGHNEEEKEGSYTPSEDSPWWFSYKRRVWDLFYREVTQQAGDNARYPYECTAFYEFVYPTYRPIFSPVLAQGKVHETLGEALGRLIAAELNNNAQLRAMVEADMPFNVFVYAHSQGGLVARAGFQSSDLPDIFKKNLAHFVSWGSPHHGAALYTLRLALQAGHDMVIDGVRLPLQNIRNSWLGGTYVGVLNSNLVLDAPGIRDLRWEAAYKDKLNIRSLFPTINDVTEAQIAIPLFSENLSIFNNEGISRELESMSGYPYTFIAGVTNKTAELDIADVRGGWWGQLREQQFRRFVADSTSIEQGAALNRLTVKQPHQPNDGAVPVYSQTGAGLYRQPQTVDMGNIDHEEFYGAEPEQRTPATIYLGELTAQKTFEVSQLDHQNRSCPVINGQIGVDGNQTVVTGRVEFPLYATASGTLGQRIQRVEARVGGQSGAVIGALAFVHEDDGSFRGSGVAANVPGGAISVVAMLKDGSEVSADVAHVPVVDPGQPWDCGFPVDYQSLTRWELPVGMPPGYHVYYTDSLNQRQGAHLFYLSYPSPYDPDATGEGKPWQHGCYQDNFKQGLWVDWYIEAINQHKKEERHYHQGELSGLSTWWRDSFYGYRMRRQTEYQNDLCHGLWKEWHENGQLYISGQCELGQRAGMWYRWRETGECWDIWDYGTGGSGYTVLPCPE